jgi:hypothetical protein
MKSYFPVPTGGSLVHFDFSIIWALLVNVRRGLGPPVSVSKCIPRFANIWAEQFCESGSSDKKYKPEAKAKVLVFALGFFPRKGTLIHTS